MSVIRPALWLREPSSIRPMPTLGSTTMSTPCTTLFRFNFADKLGMRVLCLMMVITFTQIVTNARIAYEKNMFGKYFKYRYCCKSNVYRVLSKYMNARNMKQMLINTCSTSLKLSLPVFFLCQNRNREQVHDNSTTRMFTEANTLNAANGVSLQHSR